MERPTLLQEEGVRNAGRSIAPAVSCAKVGKAHEGSHHGRRNITAFRTRRAFAGLLRERGPRRTVHA
jgi:hypothetical protein